MLRPSLGTAVALGGLVCGVCVLCALWLQTATTPDSVDQKRGPVSVSAVVGAAYVQPEVVAAPAAIALMQVRGGADGEHSGRDPLLTRDLIRVFDQILVQCTAREKAALLAQALALLPAHVPAPWLARAQGLLARYVDYRDAVSMLPRPANADDANDPNALRRGFEARAKARSRYFADEEIAGFFETEERLDRFTLDRLDIARNNALSPAAQAQALTQAEKTWLTPQQREERLQFTAHEHVEHMTADMDSRGLTDAQRFTERASVLTPEVATRLGQLDQTQRDWNARIQQIASADPAQRDTLAATLLTEQERLRLPGALALLAEKSGKAEKAL